MVYWYLVGCGSKGKSSKGMWNVSPVQPWFPSEVLWSTYILWYLCINNYNKKYPTGFFTTNHLRLCKDKFNNILYCRLSRIKYNIKQLLHINTSYNYKSFKNISTTNGTIQFLIFFLLLNNINSKIKKEKWLCSRSNILNAYTYLSCLLWRWVIINFRTILMCSNIFVSHTFFVVSTNYFENPQFFFLNHVSRLGTCYTYSAF